MDVRFELFVDDASRSVAFYRDVLGFVEQQGYGNYHPMKRSSVVIGIGEQHDVAGHLSWLLRKSGDEREGLWE